MRKIITLSSAFFVASSVCAMEPEQSQNPSIRGDEENQAVTFQDIQGLFGEFNMTKGNIAKMAIRANIINGLNSLLQRNALANEDKNEATAIANALNAANLAVRISKGGDSGDLVVLPPELVQEIISMALKGSSLKDFQNFLLVSSSFNKALMFAPVSIDLSKYGNQITNEVLEKITQIFPNMISLNLNNCRKFTNTGIVSLTKTKNLVYLNLGSTNINDTTPLSGLTKLKELTLEKTKIEDVIPLANLINLTYLNLNETKIEDVIPLTDLINLTYLNLNETKIENLIPLRGLVNLTYLNLKATQIVNISPLSGLTKLKVLDLGGNNIDNITPLANLTNLSSLDLRFNQIGDISPLKRLTNLHILYLEGNREIDDITPLKDLTNLNILSLGHTRINNVTPLEGLTELSYLYLTDIPVNDIDPLLKLTKLQSLALGRTPVSSQSLSRFRNKLPKCFIS